MKDTVPDDAHMLAPPDVLFSLLEDVIETDSDEDSEGDSPEEGALSRVRDGSV